MGAVTKEVVAKRKLAARSAKWYKENKEAKLLASAAYRLANQKKVAQYRLDYQARRQVLTKVRADKALALVAKIVADRYANLEGWPMCFHPPIADVAPEYSKCVTMWNSWQEAAVFSPPGTSSFCTDCTPEYQSREIFHGRCRHPGTIFIRDPDEPGALRGVRPVKERLAT